MIMKVRKATLPACPSGMLQIHNFDVETYALEYFLGAELIDGQWEVTYAVAGQALTDGWFCVVSCAIVPGVGNWEIPDHSQLIGRHRLDGRQELLFAVSYQERRVLG